MGRLGVLVKGEVSRLSKYGLFQATLVVTVFWLGAAWFLGDEVIEMFVPLIFLMEATMMTILLVGATMFFEKKESTVNSILVSPVTMQEYIAAKVIMNVINSMVSVAVISVGIYLMKGITFNYLLLVPAMIMVTVVHTLIGIKIAYMSLNFSSLLANYMVYVFLFLVPPVLALFNVIRGVVTDFFILLPPEASNIILGSVFREVETWRLLASWGYLLVLSVLVYRFMIKPGFDNFVMRESGV